MQNNESKRSVGVLLHITSLPSGHLGKDAFRFVDSLVNMGVSIWQTLPINLPTSDSPYQCISTHAGNPNFISLGQLVEDALLKENEAHAFTDEVMGIAYRRYCAEHPLDDFKRFCELHQFWLNDFSLFLLLRKKFDNRCWNTWPDEYKHRYHGPLEKLKIERAAAIEVIKFTQFVFFSQWAKLKGYAKKRGIRLFGDIPIFVAYDSADVWAQPHLFKLDNQKEMSVVAGVPPDYFSETGQRWGNPHYNWPAMEENHFQWWLNRIKTQTELFDMIRIDHFRGLESAWEIPAEEPNAIKGEWVTAPGNLLLGSIIAHFPQTQLIAEDLGIITDEVNTLRLQYALPGMKILHFAFDGGNDNPYLPNNIEENSVTYTGTHDNDTTLGWYQSISDNERQHFETYVHEHNENITISMPRTLIEMALNTQSENVIIPMQDILGLGTESRMNIPGTIENNWQWRFEWEALTDQYMSQFSESVKHANRHSNNHHD